MHIKSFEQRLLEDVRPGRKVLRYSLRHKPSGLFVHSERAGLGTGYFLSPEPFPRPLVAAKTWIKWLETSGDWEIVRVEMTAVEVIYPKPK